MKSAKKSVSDVAPSTCRYKEHAMKKRTTLIGSIAVLALALTACSGNSAADDDPSTVTVSNFAGGEFSGYLMEKKGFFDKEGIDVTWEYISTGPQALNALASGSIDVMWGNVQMASALLTNGRDIEVISGGVGPVFSIIGTKGASTTWPASVESLAGGSLAMPALGAGAEYLSTYMVDQAGMKKGSVSFEATGGLPQGQAALEAGKVDAVFATPVQDALLRAKGYPVLFSWLDADSYQGTAPEALTKLSGYADYDYWVDSAWAEKNDEVIQGFQAATQAGQAWLQDPANIDEIISMLRGSDFDLPALDDETFKIYVETNIRMVNADYSVEGGNAWVEAFASAGAPGMDKMPDASDWVNENLQDKQ